MKFAKRATLRFRKLLTREDGAVTIEFVLWLPMFLLVFGLIAESSFVFAGETSIMQVLQNANRQMSIGRLQTTTATEDQIKQALASLAPDATVTTTLTNGTIQSTVVVPISNLTFTGLVPEFNNLNLTVSAQMMSEG